MLSYSALMAAFDAAAAVADTAAAAQYSSAHIDAMKAFCICTTPGFPTILRSHVNNLLAGLCCGFVRSIQVGPGEQLRACGNTHYVTLCPLPPTTRETFCAGLSTAESAQRSFKCSQLSGRLLHT